MAGFNIDGRVGHPGRLSGPPGRLPVPQSGHPNPVAVYWQAAPFPVTAAFAAPQLVGPPPVFFYRRGENHPGPAPRPPAPPPRRHLGVDPSPPPPRFRETRNLFSAGEVVGFIRLARRWDEKVAGRGAAHHARGPPNFEWPPAPEDPWKVLEDWSETRARWWRSSRADLRAPRRRRPSGPRSKKKNLRPLEKGVEVPRH